jgi:single-strand DNA-binding protein
MSVNKVTLIGRIGQEPEIKQVNDNFKVAKVSLATSEKFKEKDGQQTEKTEWHNLVAFNKLAELFEKYVHKGDLLFVEGKLQTRSWEKDGKKFYATEILVNQIEFLQSKNTSQGTSIENIPNGVDQDKANNDMPF